MNQIVVGLISGTDELKVCRVCFVTDVKMFSLYEDCLKREFNDVTGLQLSADDKLTHYICYICWALLKKATSFKNRCHSSQKVLSEQVLTQGFIKRLNLSHKKQLTITNIITFNSMDNDCSAKNHYIEIKEETFLDYENDSHSDHRDDQSTFEENISIETFNDIAEIDGKSKLSITNSKENAIRVLKQNSHRRANLENSNLSNNLLNSSCDRLKKRLNKTIECKYFDNTKHKDVVDEETDSDGDFKPLSSYATKNTDENGLTSCKNCNKHENVHNCNQKDDKSDIISGKDKEKDEKDNVSPSKKTKKSKKEVRTKETIEKFDKTYNCKVVALSVEEQMEVVKARAENKKYKYGKFKCDDCYTGFVVESKFVCHRKTHDPEISGDIECKICHVRFQKRLQYMKHALRHKYKYVCKECGAVSYSRSFAKNHYEFHAGIKYECQYCKQVFSKYATRVNHIRNKHGSVECAICHDLFGPSGLALHLSLAHKQTYKCSSCDQVFNDADALKRHMRSSTVNVCDPKMRACTRCGECFTMDDVELFNMHIEEHREFKRKKRTVTDKMQRKGIPKDYVLATNEEDTINCMNMSVTSNRDMADDIRVKRRRRGGEKTKLMCEICALDNFKNITALRYHQRIHTGEKPYQCPTCPKRFRLTHTLQWHIRTHTGDRPYACTECPKAFKTNTALSRHKLVHTNERRHVCNLCGKAFQTSTNVKLHIRAVHMKIPMPPRVRNRKKRVDGIC